MDINYAAKMEAGIQVFCGKSRSTFLFSKYLSYFVAAVVLTMGIFMLVIGSAKIVFFVRYQHVFGNFKQYADVTYSLGIALVVIGLFISFAVYMKGHGLMLVAVLALMTLTGIMLFVSLYHWSCSLNDANSNKILEYMTPAHLWTYQELNFKGFFKLQEDLRCCGVFYWKDYSKDSSRLSRFVKYFNTTLPSSCCDTGCSLAINVGRKFLNHLHDRGCLFVVSHHIRAFILGTVVRCGLFGFVNAVGCLILWNYACGVYQRFY